MPEHSPSPAHHTTILVWSLILPGVDNPDRCCRQGLSCLSHRNKHNLPGRCRRHPTAGKPCSAHGRYSWWHLGEKLDLGWGRQPGTSVLAGKEQLKCSALFVKSHCSFQWRCWSLCPSPRAELSHRTAQHSARASPAAPT